MAATVQILGLMTMLVTLVKHHSYFQCVPVACRQTIAIQKTFCSTIKCCRLWQMWQIKWDYLNRTTVEAIQKSKCEMRKAFKTHVLLVTVWHSQDNVCNSIWQCLTTGQGGWKSLLSLPTVHPPLSPSWELLQKVNIYAVGLAERRTVEKWSGRRHRRRQL